MLSTCPLQQLPQAVLLSADDTAALRVSSPSCRLLCGARWLSQQQLQAATAAAAAVICHTSAGEL